jgi:hypothetical protein
MRDGMLGGCYAGLQPAAGLRTCVGSEATVAGQALQTRQLLQQEWRVSQGRGRPGPPGVSLEMRRRRLRRILPRGATRPAPLLQQTAAEAPSRPASRTAP